MEASVVVWWPVRAGGKLPQREEALFEPPGRGGGGGGWNRGSCVRGCDFFGQFFSKNTGHYFSSKRGQTDSKNAICIFFGFWSPCRSHTDRLHPYWPDRRALIPLWGGFLKKGLM